MNLDLKITGIAQSKNKSEKEPGINSHIQMPKFMLKRFADEDHKLFFYDVEKKFIAPGSARSINTEKNYYSPRMESKLNKLIENPFSKIIRYFDEIDFDTWPINKPDDFEITIKAFLS